MVYWQTEWQPRTVPLPCYSTKTWKYDMGGGARHDEQPAPTLTLWTCGLILPSNSYTDFIKQIIVVNREDSTNENM